MIEERTEYNRLLKTLLSSENIYPSKFNKCELIKPLLSFLDEWHYKNNIEYRNMILSDGEQDQGTRSFGIPVRMFKNKSLMSVSKDQIVKTLLSSGTTGQLQAQIYLDISTSRNQSLILTKIMKELLGSKRVPMLIVDSEAVISNRNIFSARAAGIRGFSMFGKDIHFALTDDLEFNAGQVEKIFNKYSGKPKLIFGFTFLIWKSFIDKLKKQSKILDFEESILLHGGGWKKLESEKVSKSEFKKRFIDLGFKSIHDYYGMVEQTGSIFIECDSGYFHSNVFNNVSVIDPLNLKMIKMVKMDY